MRAPKKVGDFEKIGLESRLKFRVSLFVLVKICNSQALQKDNWNGFNRDSFKDSSKDSREVTIKSSDFF